MAADEPRILIVEDEPLVLLDLQDIVADLGFRVVGTAGHLSRALELCGSEDFDVAILDVNLQGQRIDPVAETIHSRGVPIVFLTGYAGEFAGRPHQGTILEKPCTPDAIARALQQAIGQAP